MSEIRGTILDAELRMHRFLHDLSIPSPDEVEAARTPPGGWTKAQLAEWGLPWPPPKGWKRWLEQEWERVPQRRSIRPDPFVNPGHREMTNPEDVATEGEW
jgi:hypothetical protein